MPTIDIDENLHEQVTERVETSSFDDVEEYVAFVLKTVTADHLALGDEFNSSQEDRDTEDVEDDLKALGYLE